MKKKRNKETRLRENLKALCKFIAFLLLLAFINIFVIANIKVPTGSMLNTINKGDRLIVSRADYWFKDPERYDIILFKSPDEYAKGKTKLFVKRVIGLPGETVQIVSGVVYVTDKNGNTTGIRGDYLAEEARGDYGPYKVPEGSYFCLGDNRNHSGDSRFWKNKYVKRSLVLGKVKFRYYPKLKIIK